MELLDYKAFERDDQCAEFKRTGPLYREPPLAPGTHSFTWNGATAGGMPPGDYKYRSSPRMRGAERLGVDGGEGVVDGIDLTNRRRFSPSMATNIPRQGETRTRTASADTPVNGLLSGSRPEIPAESRENRAKSN